jgi:ubiquinone/menaquinone biosynthesis C-methylase UbiE
MTTDYIMENPEENIRLEIKTDPEAVKKQALWCGLKPGMKVLDAGCGPGIVTSILNEFIQPDGKIVGVDYSEERIEYAKKHYSKGSEIDYLLHDLREPLYDFGEFDLVWARFVLEYNLAECSLIVKNLSDCLKPGGLLCLLDLDYNCLTHYELPEKMGSLLSSLMKKFETEFNFDPYVGRKLYSYLYDLDYEDIKADLIPHHLFYGELEDSDAFNWLKKIEVASLKLKGLFEEYPGGISAFVKDFNSFFLDPRRFTYTPLIICKGSKSNPAS